MAMPTQDCIGSDDGRDLLENLSSQHLALGRQAAAFIVTEQKAYLAQPIQENLNLGVLELNQLLLMEIDPAGQGHQQKLPGLQDEAHIAPDR
jgi:hypothetical protein